jgi:hypothetical protein
MILIKHQVIYLQPNPWIITYYIHKRGQLLLPPEPTPTVVKQIVELVLLSKLKHTHHLNLHTTSQSVMAWCPIEAYSPPKFTHHIPVSNGMVSNYDVKCMHHGDCNVDSSTLHYLTMIFLSDIVTTIGYYIHINPQDKFVMDHHSRPPIVRCLTHQT